MEKSIIENNQLHLLGRVLFVVSSELLVSSFLNSINAWASFVYIRSFSKDRAIFINFSISLEISEKHISHKHIIIKATGVSESLLSDLV